MTCNGWERDEEREGDSDKENRVGERKTGIYTRLSFSIVL